MQAQLYFLITDSRTCLLMEKNIVYSLKKPIILEHYSYFSFSLSHSTSTSQLWCNYNESERDGLKIVLEMSVFVTHTSTEIE